MLAQDVRKLTVDASVPANVRAVAKQLMERYKYPVDFQIIDAAGNLYAQASANEYLRSYLAALKSGVDTEKVVPAPK